MASSITPKMYGQSANGNTLVIQAACIAHTDGTFTNYQITSADIGFEYWKSGYFICHAWAVNPASGNPTAGAVTVTDETGQVIIGTATTGDVLTLSTAANGIGYLLMTRSTGQLPVSSKLTVAVSDTGAGAFTFTLYLVLIKYPS